MKKVALLLTIINLFSESYSNTCCNQQLDLNFTTEEVDTPSNDLIVQYSFSYPKDSIMTVDSIWYSFTNNEGLAVSENRLVFRELIEEQPTQRQIHISFDHESTRTTKTLQMQE
ncbi:MAG: hypothetical protein ACJARP_001104 [Vicingaceae bacterium]|jgi:hypothetical protein